MRIALAQTNPTLGDFEANFDTILENIGRAKDRHCELVVFPELALMGYSPMDLLERDSIVQAQLKYLEKLNAKMPEGIAALVGAVTRVGGSKGKRYHNSAVYLQKNKKPKYFHKQLLPTYDVFDEARFFQPGDTSKNFLKIKGKNVLVTICEDIWAPLEPWPGTRYQEDPIKGVKKSAVDLVVNMSASPFAKDKLSRRHKVVKHLAHRLRCPVVYTNMVGGQDELVFDGGSFVTDADGKTITQSVFFSEDLNVVDLKKVEGGLRPVQKGEVARIRQALVLGIRDFVAKTGLSRVHLGLSGGIDSALVACLAVDAVGPQRVTAIALPGPYSSTESMKLAQGLVENLHCQFKVIPVDGIYQGFKTLLDQELDIQQFGVVHENLQARIRAVALMAFANSKNSLLLNTSNKSEFATGYTTLYGDMCGGLAPIGDLLKTQVVELCRHYNEEFPLIPEGIISRPPTAELRPDQVDEDTLPPYERLDRMIQKSVVDCGPLRGTEGRWVLESLCRSEFKRWQAPPVLRVSSHAFGRGRRFPIAHRANF